MIPPPITSSRPGMSSGDERAGRVDDRAGRRAGTGSFAACEPAAMMQLSKRDLALADRDRRSAR